MMISTKQQNSISFGSKINFVPLKEFQRIKSGIVIESTSFKNILKGEKFWTEEIKTCVSGGLVYNEGGIGWHLFHTEKILKNLDIHIAIIKNQLQGQLPHNGLLLGSKKYIGTPFSRPIFKEMKEEMQKLTPNISLFECHKYMLSETHMMYSKHNDTWTLCANKARFWRKDKSVDSLRELLNFYETIRIAPTDKLYINGKLINKHEAPRIFG